MSKTVYDILKDEIGDREIWNYEMYGPLSLDDEAVVTIKMIYGEKKAEYVEEYIIPLKG